LWLRCSGCGGTHGTAGTAGTVATTATDPHGSTTAAAPSTPTDADCPRTAGGGHSAKGIAISLGHGPAYPALGMAAGPPSPRGVASLNDDTYERGVYVHKTLWAISRRAPSDVLIRARGYHDRQRVNFFDGRAQHRTLQLPRPSDPWGYAVTTTLLPGPGCYAFEVTGRGLKQRIVFQATLDRRRR
jgi:hypothetical protein